MDGRFLDAWVLFFTGIDFTITKNYFIFAPTLMPELRHSLMHRVVCDTSMERT